MPKRKREQGAAGELAFDMTPMIDVVFQLIIFFMVALSFAKTEVEAKLFLPVAQAAKPPERAEEELFVVNVINVYEKNAKGLWEFPDPRNRSQPDVNRPYVIRGKQRKTVEQLRAALKEKARLSKFRSDKDEVTAAVIIRGDRNVVWEEMFRAMLECRDAGFIKVYLKALTRTPVD